MLVRKIIESKKIADIITVKPADSVTSVAQLLATKRIGAVIVSGDGAMVDGILSERDIVRALGTEGVSCMDKQVRELMTATVIACKLDETSHSVMERMTEGRFRHMPVVEDGRMVGVISIGDVVKARISEIQVENAALADMIAGNT